MHRWQVFAVVSVGVFMAEPRPLHRQHRVPGHPRATSAGRASPACPGSSTPTRSCSPRCSSRPGGSPTAPAASAASSAGSRSSSPPRRSARPRPRSRCWSPRASLQAAGAALHACRPRSACCCPSSRPRSAPTAVGVVGGRRRRRRRGRPADRRAARARSSWRWVFLVNVPVGLVALVVGGARCCASARRRPRGRAPTCSAPCCSPRRSRCSRSASSRARTGAGAAPRVLGVVRRRRPCSCLRSSLRSARHPAPVVELADAARALVRGRERRARCCSSPPSPRCCSRSVLFLTGVWHYSVLRAGLELAPGPG